MVGMVTVWAIYGMGTSSFYIQWAELQIEGLESYLPTDRVACSKSWHVQPFILGNGNGFLQKFKFPDPESKRIPGT